MAGPRSAPLCLLVALALDAFRVHGDLDAPRAAALYLPAALELLDAPEHFRVQRASHYPPANSSLGARSETFLLLQPWPRAPPLLRASYPPFAIQQVVPPQATEPPRQPVPWDVRAVSVEAAVTPTRPHARVVFHLRGQDWPPGPGGLPCARLYATHPAGTAQRACRFQVSGRPGRGPVPVPGQGPPGSAARLGRALGTGELGQARAPRGSVTLRGGRRC